VLVSAVRSSPLGRPFGLPDCPAVAVFRLCCPLGGPSLPVIFHHPNSKRLCGGGHAETLGALGGRTLLHCHVQVVLRAPVGLSVACLVKKLSDAPPELLVIPLVKAWSFTLEGKVPCKKRLKTRSTAKPYIRATLPVSWQATTKCLWQSSKKTRTHYPKKPQMPHPSAPGTKLRPNRWGSLRHCCLCISTFSASSKDREGNCHWF